jgi:cytochrome c556
MYLGKVTAALAAAAVMTVSTGTFADDADAAIKYRKNVMAAVGAHTKALVAILKGEVSNTDALALHAAGLANATNTALTVAAFKQNTDGQGVEKTTSTAKIWEDFPRFEKSLTDLAAAAVEIEKTAAAGGLAEFDQLKPALKECGFCHRDSGFRDK